LAKEIIVPLNFISENGETASAEWLMRLRRLFDLDAKGQLVGYGGGLDRKRALLQFEAIVRDFGPQPLMPRRNPFPGTDAGSS